jgi:hypothetical protein
MAWRGHRTLSDGGSVITIGEPVDEVSQSQLRENG